MRYRSKTWIRALSCLLVVALPLVFLASFEPRLSPEDPFGALSDLENFAFLMGRDRSAICSSKRGPKLLILVHSATGNRYRREAIRKTWASLPDTRTVFLIGLDSARKESLQREMHHHRDMVQGNFVDSYKNLTYKHLMGLTWAVTFCPSAQAVLKVDDDVFVDPFRVSDLLHSFDGLARTLVCAVIPNGSLPVRKGPKKVTSEEYPLGKRYPKYCAGMAYLTSVPVAELLLVQSKKIRFFWVDDVYVTGLLAESVGLAFTNWIRWYSDEFERDVLAWLVDDSNRKPAPFMAVELRQPEDVWLKITEKLWAKTAKSWNDVDV